MLVILVPVVRVARSELQSILSPLRLPFRHIGFSRTGPDFLLDLIPCARIRARTHSLTVTFLRMRKTKNRPVLDGDEHRAQILQLSGRFYRSKDLLGLANALEDSG